MTDTPKTPEEKKAAWKKYDEEKAQFDRDFAEVQALEEEGDSHENEGNFSRACAKIEKSLGIISRSGHDHWHPEHIKRLKAMLKRNFALAKGY